MKRTKVVDSNSAIDIVDSGSVVRFHECGLYIGGRMPKKRKHPLPEPVSVTYLEIDAAALSEVALHYYPELKGRWGLSLTANEERNNGSFSIIDVMPADVDYDLDDWTPESVRSHNVLYRLVKDGHYPLGKYLVLHYW